MLYREPKNCVEISLCETCFNETATMAEYNQIVLYTFLLLINSYVQSTEIDTENKEDNVEELVPSESKDGKLEIIKRIKKINDDGSYTIGYEADDGSFKIESRDVLGHIKGTYGFVDDEGQIKRVSYSTSNSSEVIAKVEPTVSSVVQRIPSRNKTGQTTKRPSTQSTPSSTSSTVIQSITRRRATTSTSTTTQKPNYHDVVNVSSRTTNRPSHISYTSAPPRVLLQGRPSAISTAATNTHTSKSEGQIIRPDVVTVKPTELPLFRRLALKHLENDKPVTEEGETEIRGNLLRRQLTQDNTGEYDIQEHLYNLQQSLGQDATDVYSSSVTTGTPRPLFTTTTKPRNIITSSTTPTPYSASRPTLRYPHNYQRNVPQDLEQHNTEYSQETTTTPQPIESTPQAIPIVQIPANRPAEPLVAIRHPFQGGAILVPLSQLQGRIIPVENMKDVVNVQQQYSSQGQYLKEITPKQNNVEIEQEQAIVRRLPPPPLRPIPVQVDENGFIRELPRQVSTPYPIPVPVTPIPKYINDEEDNSVDNIEPPVSTKDFQKLLQQLIARQSRLERISALARNPEYYLQQRFRPHPQEASYFIRKEPIDHTANQVPFNQQYSEQNNQYQRQFETIQPEEQPKQNIRPNIHNYYSEQYENQSYRPNRRVARLLPNRGHRNQELQQYLPPEVREMLLLRMLQLAINPALPVSDGDFMLPTSTPPHASKVPVRNVEILGEEEHEPNTRRPDRTKRFREMDTEYE